MPASEAYSLLFTVKKTGTEVVVCIFDETNPLSAEIETNSVKTKILQREDSLLFSPPYVETQTPTQISSFNFLLATKVRCIFWSKNSTIVGCFHSILICRGSKSESFPLVAS